MPTRAERSRGQADAASGVHLRLVVDAGAISSEIVLDAGHCERLFRMAAYRAIRAGRFAPAVPLFGRVVADASNAPPDPELAVEDCVVEVADATGDAVRTRFAQKTFAALAAARATRLLADAGADLTARVVYRMYTAPVDAEPLPIAVPVLPEVSLAVATAGAQRHGQPDDAWIATVVSSDVVDGFHAMERESRRSGVEVAARIYTRVGFDPERRTFLRVLDRLVIARATRATALSVVSTAASWSEVLTGPPPDHVRTLSSAHTHLHVPALQERHGAEALRADGDPCISVDDIVTHYVAFPDPLAAVVIVSVFPARCEIGMYGYAPDALLRPEPGYWERRHEGVC